MRELNQIRRTIRAHHVAGGDSVLNTLVSAASISPNTHAKISQRATLLVKNLRADDKPGLMEVFLAEYGLSTDEGVALMCLAEALLRVPDNATMQDLIEDKIAPSSWGAHLGQSSSSLVNASTWALMLTGKVLDNDEAHGVSGVLHGAVKRMGEPVIRRAVKRAMKEMGNQFVLGETIGAALRRGRGMENKGFTYSFDMLGEAALTSKDAQDFFDAYYTAIEKLGEHAHAADIKNNPGISIKLSALHPRYERTQKTRVMEELVVRVKSLAQLAKSFNMGLNIDAEEADRLDLSLDVIEAVLSDPDLAGWDGFGVVVQAYGKRCTFVIDWLYALAKNHDRKIMVRLVKGAYWDSEIKRAQIDGVAGFPVYTRKAATDISYICCAKKLLAMTDRIYPQFATHNAHSIAAILELAATDTPYEFQRLHGMGEVLHTQVLQAEGTRCRIYAPVGAHQDLLAYLVRRLLENGANSSFVNQIVDESVPASVVAADPFAVLESKTAPQTSLKNPQDLFAPERTNSRGWDIQNQDDVEEIDAAREEFKTHQWSPTPLMAVAFTGEPQQTLTNPANPKDKLGNVIEATSEDVDLALAAATHWGVCPSEKRAAILNKAADLYEDNFGEIFAALTREAGKTVPDAISELREAVDFLRYYAARIDHLGDHQLRGLITCISPWNFPLAIFTGQIAAALAAGNGVLAKPADPTPIIAHLAVTLLHKAGVPTSVLQLLPGKGSIVGARLSAAPRIDGVCFTGSTATAQTIHKAMAHNISPDAPLIAETGGLNAMVVDSTALPEQAVKDIVASAFQSTGQRCSALRMLYVQKDIAPHFMDMLYGAMDELRVGDPWHLDTDIGPVIDLQAKDKINAHIQDAKKEGRLLKHMKTTRVGHYVGPTVIQLGGILDMEEEIFGPVLHVATFEAHEIGKIIKDINTSGYGLTFGLHTRIDDRVEYFTERLNVGNIYVNRNQIGAIVGSQPFGGEGLSGTGPKAGGPHYMNRFCHAKTIHHPVTTKPHADVPYIQSILNDLQNTSHHLLRAQDLPGPTGESNRLSEFPKGVVLCLGPSLDDAYHQAEIAMHHKCPVLIIVPGAVKPEEGARIVDGYLPRSALAHLQGFHLVALWSDTRDQRRTRQALANREGAIISLACNQNFADQCILERHICIDTTAAGGNTSLLAENS
jgi:RHH-type proline utilization regulon transcriptional repressor/proline dehydrogenase/delta 1-pyrroline-5-carboxylate dehydrogenase